ncbi:unnamed protein product [Adineta ricciae]|uniref:Uncharacterized protein n=1 Tax=Adineta ricciae TaxID=249248 RepID=A0A815Y091_ADIRI|nr:unnamed protein product [Adineta ricciae]
MTSYLAPESPRPYSIAAERYFQRLNFATGLSVANNERIYPLSKCRFGAQYEKELCTYLAKHAEVNCSDRVCLVGEESEWATIIQERLFLNKPIQFIDCKLHHDAIKEQLASNIFDRIILFNCLHHINHVTMSENIPKLHANIISPLMLCINLLRKALIPTGRLVIVHREPNINTLPLPVEVIETWYNTDEHSSRIIEQLHGEKRPNLEFLWEVETIKFTMQKLSWYNELMHRTFYPLPLCNQKQIADGLRLLNETYFKYHQGLLEMYDRLLFLTVQTKFEPVKSSVSLPKASQSLLTSRFRRKPGPLPTGSHEKWDYKMLVTDEVTQLLNINEQRQSSKRNLFKSSLPFI